MKIFEVINEFELGDMRGILFKDGETVSFTVIPAAMADKIAEHRRKLNDLPSCRDICQALKFDIPALHNESMAQLKIAGDGYAGGFSAGTTLRNSQSCEKMKFKAFRENSPGNFTVTFEDEARGLGLEQNFVYQSGQTFFTITTTLCNRGSEAFVLDMLYSFSLGCLSPFQAEDGAEKYKVHRWLSNWSHEGRIESKFIEEHNLEVSWAGFGERSLRFGQQGSMVTKGFFPMLAFEDCEHNVVWGVELEALGSWQLELSRQKDFFNISGGMVDREYGQWRKTLAPGEKITTMTAAVSCVNGSLDELLSRLCSFQTQPRAHKPESEQSLPVIFNDWCSSWGRPVEAKLTPILERLQGCGVTYFVLDAGWFNDADNGFTKIGDWNIPIANYPNGLRAFTDKIRSYGFLPGVWFEFEIATTDSIFYHEHPDWLLHLDGKVLLSGNRVFLDFRKPEVIDYLDNKLIKMLKDNNFSYLKVDYNAPTGAICDGNTYKAEALREYQNAVEKYFLHLRQELPELVVEICSSGGHRLSPGWMRIGDMGSFSDAHEGIEIPIIAANTAQLIPMTHNQVWAVLRTNDSEKRLYYSLSAGFMGRFCLSGDIAVLPSASFDIMSEAVKFYHSISAIFKSAGVNHIDRRLNSHSYLHAKGGQIFTRTSGDDKKMVVIAHTFAESSKEMTLELSGSWQIKQMFKQDCINVSINGSTLIISNLSDFCGLCIELTAK